MTTAQETTKRRPAGRRGFTLVEMLVVIAIIAVLAGLIAGGTHYAVRRQKIKAVETQLKAFIDALEHYHDEIGTYPPAHPTDPGLSSLYYELVGTEPTGSGDELRTLAGDHKFSQAVANAAFGINGFINTKGSGSGPKNFLEGYVVQVTTKTVGNGDVHLLAVPLQSATGTNVWKYVRGPGAHNPKTFDLWAEITIGGETLSIRNWK